MSIQQPARLSAPLPSLNPAARKPFPVKFGNAVPHVGPMKPNRLLEALDFTAVGASPVKQVGVIFTSLILWRLLAANERRRTSVSKRWNEMRENVMRDFLGFGFWFLGVPVLQRAYLRWADKRNPQFRNILIQTAAANQAKPGTWFDKLKAINPLSRYYIPSSQQVRDQMHQAVLNLEKGSAAYQRTLTNYTQLIKHRNYATALGLGSTILLLGVGINLLNYYLTRKNMANAVHQPNGPVPLPGQTTAMPVAQVSPFATVGVAGRQSLLMANPFQARKPMLGAGASLNTEQAAQPVFY